MFRNNYGKLIEIKFLTTFQIMTNMKKIEKILKSIKKILI